MIACSTNRTARISWFDHLFEYPPDILFLDKPARTVSISVVESHVSTRYSSPKNYARVPKGGGA